MSVWFDGAENALCISFKKNPAIPAHLRIFRACAYASIAPRAAHPHTSPAFSGMTPD